MFKLKSFATLVAVSTLLLSPFSAIADDNDDEKDAEQFNPLYSSILITSVDSGFSNIDRAIGLGGTIGILIPGVVVSGTNILAAEIDLNSTVIPGKNNGGSGSLTGNCNDGGGNGGDDGGLGGLGGLLGGGDGGNGGGSECSTTSGSEDFQMQAIGIFAKARSPGRFFGSARIGYRYVISTIAELEEDQTGSAWGLGVGYQYNKSGAAFELNYSQYGSRLSFITLAVNYAFGTKP